MLSGEPPVWARRWRGLPLPLRRVAERLGLLPPRDVLLVCVARQRMIHRRWDPKAECHLTAGVWRISTARAGVHNAEGSRGTPPGLHRVARRIGGGWPVGAVWKGRRFAGWTWRGQPDAAIAHRILWLEGLEPGINRGGHVDSFARYIYIHGVGDETTLGRPASSGCIHLAAKDLLPLFDRLEEGAWVWIAERLAGE
ncbi:MAG: L,D-transpeptidase [Verrucomicrobia bacterium]|nr:MAG: L,D-transpeptidase [Verrucomicrobiota bacterium]